MEVMDTRWLEFGVTSALLVSVIIYLLKYHIPQLIKTFEEGFGRVSVALKEVNTQLLVLLKHISHMEERLLDKAADDWKEHGKECRDIAKSAENQTDGMIDSVKTETQMIANELREMRQAVYRLLEAISKTL